METKFRSSWLVGGLSVLLLGVVSLLYLGPKFTVTGDYSFIPAINAIINGTTAIVLLAGFFAIKKGNRNHHRKLMATALILSTLFLVGYVIYHSTSESTKFGGTGWIVPVYKTILLSHIVLAAAMVPLVLTTVVRAIKGDFERHKKIARITFPIWFYVSITGVIVYLLISPYYP